jgi:N-methylhydantoinase A
VTTTDANVYLERINRADFCGGIRQCNGASVETAFENLIRQEGPSEPTRENKISMARRVIGVANGNMVEAIRLISVNRGLDPRHYSLFAFGGGGGLHACSLAIELGMKEVIVPRMSSVFSAWGMLQCDIRKDFYQSSTHNLGTADLPKTDEA